MTSTDDVVRIVRARGNKRRRHTRKPRNRPRPARKDRIMRSPVGAARATKSTTVPSHPTARVDTASICDCSMPRNQYSSNKATDPATRIVGKMCLLTYDGEADEKDSSKNARARPKGMAKRRLLTRSLAFRPIA